MNLPELKNSNRILFECRSGSFAYGTNTEKSDVDIKGIFYQSKDELISLHSNIEQINDEKNDVSYYSLRRYIELASTANPNILELLYMPEDCIRKRSKLYDKLLDFREEFITKKCLESHQAYAMAQIKKARGRNKWINNPQPKEKPKLEDFAYIIPHLSNSSMPGRPTKYSKSNLYDYPLKASSLEHCPGLYRIYKSKMSTSIFKDNQICCSSISLYEETPNFLGFLYLNEDAYRRSLKDHANYWEWINKRNPERWKLQEIGELDFDAKNMQHTIRLLLTAKHIVETGKLKVRFEGDELKYLKNIRKGNYSYSELIEQSESINNEINQIAINSTLKPVMSPERASEIFLELMNSK